MPEIGSMYLLALPLTRDVLIKGNLEAANITIKNPDGSIAFGGPNVKSIPNMGFLSTGYAPIQIPPPGFFLWGYFCKSTLEHYLLFILPVSGLGNKYAVLCCFISFDKLDNGIVAQARVYARIGGTTFYGTTAEVSYADFQKYRAIISCNSFTSSHNGRSRSLDAPLPLMGDTSG